MVRHLSLESALPILKSRKRVLVLLTNNLSLMEVVRKPTPGTILSACKRLHARAIQQRAFGTDHWGSSVTKLSRAEVLEQQRADIDREAFPPAVQAAIEATYQRIFSSYAGPTVDFFDIRTG